MPTINTILIDSLDVAALVLEISDHTGESAADGLTRLLPNISAGNREAILNDVQILQEKAENAALPEDASTGELPKP